MSTLASQVADKLLEISAIRLSPNEPFTWASGLRSPIYCDNRISLSHPEVRDFIKESLKSKVWAFGDFDAVAGVATAGIPHGVLLADRVSKPFLYVRSKSKSHGRQNKIEGELHEGQRILVVEDLISTGMSSVAACEAIQEAGGQVIGVLAIFTYGLKKSLQLFTEKKIPMDSLTNYETLLEQAVANNHITLKEKETLDNWNKDPLAWSESIQSK